MCTLSYPLEIQKLGMGTGSVIKPRCTRTVVFYHCNHYQPQRGQLHDPLPLLLI